jgi:hypothetical protein
MEVNICSFISLTFNSYIVSRLITVWYLSHLLFFYIKQLGYICVLNCLLYLFLLFLFQKCRQQTKEWRSGGTGSLHECHHLFQWYCWVYGDFIEEYPNAGICFQRCLLAYEPILEISSLNMTRTNLFSLTKNVMWKKWILNNLKMYICFQSLPYLYLCCCIVLRLLFRVLYMPKILV